jgi:hypothetical protein
VIEEVQTPEPKSPEALAAEEFNALEPESVNPPVTDAKPGEKPPETDGLPETKDPVELRKAYAKLKQEIEGLRAAQPKPAQVATPPLGIDFDSPTGFIRQGVQQPVPAAPQMQQQGADQVTPQLPSPEYALNILVKAEQGEATEEERQGAENAMQFYTPAQLRDVIGRARAGYYGANGKDIAKMARERLPEVQAAYEQHREQQQVEQAILGGRKQSLEKIKAIPGMADKTSEVYKGYLVAAQTLDKRIPGFFNMLVDAPELVHEYQQLITRAQAGEKVAELQSENARLKQQLESIRGPQAAGLPAATSGVKKTPEQEFAEGMAALGVT